MTDLNTIIAGSSAIERLLTEQFGATGRGMREKLDAVPARRLPAALRAEIQALARLRNRAVHEPDFVLHDTAVFAARCARVCQQLRALPAAGDAAARPAARGRPAPLAAGWHAVLPLLAVAAVAAWWFQRHPPEPAGADLAAVPQAAPAVPGGAAAAAYALHDVRLDLVRDHAGRDVPRIRLVLVNRTGAPLRQVQLRAQVRLPGQTAPLLDAAALALRFAAPGLAHGAAAAVELRPDGPGWDAAPLHAAIGAGQAQLALQVDNAREGGAPAAQTE